MTLIHRNCGGKLEPMDYSIEVFGESEISPFIIKENPEFLCERCSGIVRMPEVDFTPLRLRHLGMTIGTFPVYLERK